MIQKDTIRKIISHKLALAGLIIIGLITTLALFAPLLSSYLPSEIFSDKLRLPPFSDGHLLGTDDVGRDQWTRLLYGARISLIIGIGVVLVSGSIGITLGLLSGYFGGKIDNFIMRLIDILMSLPSILLAIVVVSVTGPGLFNTILAASIVGIPSFARITRSSVLLEKEKLYAKASVSFGAKSPRIILLTILPNCLSPLFVQASLGFSEGILSAAALGFLGLGAQAPMPEWGLMLADSRAYIMSSPWLVTLPGLCILITVVGFNLLADGLRDIFDPRLRSS